MRVPEVSILMPLRNEQRHLPAAIASLRRQSLADWELVAVDDGSTDRTGELLKAAADTDSRIRVLSRPAGGIVKALNAGLETCRAPLVARFDGDDVCHRRRLELQVRLLGKQPQTDLVASAVRHFPRPQLQDGMRAYERWQNRLIDNDSILRDLFVESPFAHPSVLFRKQAVTALGGYRQTDWAEDYDLWLRMAQVGHRFASLPQTLLYCRDRPQRLTRTAANCSADAFRACKVHYLSKDYLKGVSRITLWGAGMEGKAWRKALQVEGVEVCRWAEIDPRKIGQVIHGAPVVSIKDLQPGDGKTLVTVGAKGARRQVRAWATGLGLCEGTDFIYVT